MSSHTSKARPARLHYTGHGEWFDGVPARNLNADDIAELTDAQLAAITAEHPKTGKALYREPSVKKAERVTAKAVNTPAPEIAPEDGKVG